MPSSSSSKLAELVESIKSSDVARTQTLCNEISPFDVNSGVECDSDGEEDFPLQVALGARFFSLSYSIYICVCVCVFKSLPFRVRFVFRRLCMLQSALLPPPLFLLLCNSHPKSLVVVPKIR